MKPQVNIIHPYTYKLEGNTLQIGPCEEHTERDTKVSSLVNKALNVGTSIIKHRYYDFDPVALAIHDAALISDPLYICMVDQRIENVNTTSRGHPIPDTKPKEINSEHWEIISRAFTSSSQLREKIGDSNPIIFIGGLLECCVTNTIGYIHDHLGINGEQMFYVPELCVSFYPEVLVDAQAQLENMKVKAISYEETMRLIA